MPSFKLSMPHVASIHDANGKPAFSVCFIMPKKGVIVLVKKDNKSAKDNYYYSFLIEGTEDSEWRKPINEIREGMASNNMEVVSFIIPTDNQGASNHGHAHLHIEDILSSGSSLLNDLIQHDGTIHFPSGASK